MLDEVAEHVERLRLEFHLATVTTHDHSIDVQLAIGKTKDHRPTIRDTLVHSFAHARTRRARRSRRGARFELRG